MKSLKISCYIFLVFAFLIVTVSVNSFAKEDMQSAMKADKTGTNPIIFINGIKVYNEFLWLNGVGDPHRNVTTVEYRTPFAEGKWLFRTRLRRVEVDNGVDEAGFGDMDFRFLTVPYLDMSKKMAIGVGFETFLNTASDDALGSGATSLGPQVFGVFFKPFNGMFDLIAPGYQHKFSVHEESGRSEVRQDLIGLLLLKKSKDKQRWMLIDQRFVLDYENNREFMLIDFEVGMMLDKHLGTTGHSIYVRPSIGIGENRLSDGSIEAGYKIVW
jgi:hypothetical protein